MPPGNVVSLHPAAEIARRDWCAAHWPWGIAMRQAREARP